MIGWLRGNVLEVGELGAEGLCVLDVNGVGYEVQLSASHINELRSVSTTVVVWVHTHVREDAFVLFGFRSPTERRAFRALLSVSGIGPRSALSILGALTLDALADAIAQGNLALLQKVPGVGKKSAERIALELKNSTAFSDIALDGAVRVGGSKKPALPQKPEHLQHVYQALINLGYRAPEAQRAVDTLPPVADETNRDHSTESLLRAALASLS